MLRFLGFLFATGFIIFCGIAVGAGYIIWETQKDLPDYKQLAFYEPPVMTRVHAADGSLIAEYAKQRRLFIPVDAVPRASLRLFSPPRTRTSTAIPVSTGRASGAPLSSICKIG